MGSYLSPAEHAEILGRWELFTNMRMLTALAAFGLLRRDEEGPGCARLA